MAPTTRPQYKLSVRLFTRIAWRLMQSSLTYLGHANTLVAV